MACHLRREIEDIKKNQMEFLKMKNKIFEKMYSIGLTSD